MLLNHSLPLTCSSLHFSCNIHHTQSMATNFFSYTSPSVLIQTQDSYKVLTRRRCRLLMMCANNSVSAVNNTSIQIKSFNFIKNKVYEDRSAGIVCYKDENGEMICEGYDEGPRFDQNVSRFSCNSRDVEIIDLLQRCWIHVYDENEMERVDKERNDCNGLKKLC